MTTTVDFAFRIGARVRVRATRLEGQVTALMINAQGLQLVQFHDDRVGGGYYHWHREEELQRVEN